MSSPTARRTGFPRPECQPSIPVADTLCSGEVARFVRCGAVHTLSDVPPAGSDSARVISHEVVEPFVQPAVPASKLGLISSLRRTVYPSFEIHAASGCMTTALWASSHSGVVIAFIRLATFSAPTENSRTDSPASDKAMILLSICKYDTCLVALEKFSVATP